jgi:signal transduction histidine kinase
MDPDRVHRFESDAAISFLTRVTRMLAALPADISEAAAQVAHLAVPTLGDWCIIELVDGAVRRLTVAHGDPEQDTRSDRLARMSAGERNQEIDAQNRTCVPLAAFGRPIGSMWLLSSDSGSRFGSDLLRVAESFAAMAALALDNCLLRGEAAAAERTRTEFVGSVVQELRTPLHVVMGYADLLDAGIPEPLPERARRQVEHIRRAADHLLEVVDQVLSVSRLPAAVETVTPTPVALDVLARELVLLLEPLAVAKGLRFTAHLPENLPRVITDVGKLRRILYSLLSNAIKFTDHGSVGLTVRSEADQVVLEVTDSGSGIATGDLARIFEAFRGTEPTRTDPRRSWRAGLGLNISQRLVRLLGGEISALSVLGEGTTMRIALPLRFRRLDSSREGQ